MTHKKDLKRRVRARQARTGESYTAARANIVAAKPPATEATPAIPFEEMISLPDAPSLGFRCDVLASSRLLAVASAPALLSRIHAALTATADDPGTSVLRAVAFRGERPPGDRLSPRWWEQTRRFGERVRAGIGGVSDRGDMMALHIGGVFVLCTATHGRALPPLLPPVAPRLLLTIADGTGLDPRGALAFIR